jgi:hypothetical protein
MIVWNGKGYLVAVLAFAFLVLAEYGSEAMFHDQSYYQNHGWPLAAALVFAGIASWVLGRYLARSESRVVIDKATGQELTLGGNDALFFIPVRFWAPIFIAGAIAALAYRGV